MKPTFQPWIAAGTLALTLGIGAGATETADPMPVARPAQLHWVPKETLPPGAFAAPALGDPHHADYAFYGRFPKGFRVPAHWHTGDVGVVMLEGTMTIEYDNRSPSTMGVSESFLLPAKQPYVALCPEGCLFLAWGHEPFDIHYVRPEDDPRRGAAK